MPKVSTKHVQRRIAELDAQYTVAQPKRQGLFTALRGVLALIILAIIAVAGFSSVHRTTSDFSRLTLKEGPMAPKRQLSDAEAQAKWNAMWGSASTGLKRE
jgi:hypothetical protein